MRPLKPPQVARIARKSSYKHFPRKKLHCGARSVSSGSDSSPCPPLVTCPSMRARACLLKRRLRRVQSLKSEFSTSASEREVADAKVHCAHLTRMNEVGHDTWAAKLTNRSGQKKMRHPTESEEDACKIRRAVKHEFPLCIFRGARTATDNSPRAAAPLH